MSERESFLRSALIPLSHQSTGRYGLFHPGSGVMIAVDRLGVLAARELLGGASLAQARQRLALTGRLSHAGFDALAAALAQAGALGEVTGPRWRREVRALACRWLGVAGLRAADTLVALPYSAQRWLLSWLPRAVLGPRVMAQARWYLDGVLTASGYGEAPAVERERLIRAVCQATTRTMLFGLLSVVAAPTHAGAWLRRVVEARGAAEVDAAVAAGGAVVACLHSEGYLALLARHAHTYARAACAVRAEMVSVNLDAHAPASDAVTRALGAQMDNTDPMAARRLADYLRAGGIVTLPFDGAPLNAPTTHVELLAGRPLRASRGPAWLAVRSGRPLYFATTHWDGQRVVIDYGEPLSVPGDLTRREQVTALTTELYQRANRWVEAHPGAWTGWTFLEHYLAEQPAQDAFKVTAQVTAQVAVEEGA